MEGMKAYKDKEAAAENIYFKQEEHRMLKELAAKIRKKVRNSYAT